MKNQWIDLIYKNDLLKTPIVINKDSDFLDVMVEKENSIIDLISRLKIVSAQIQKVPTVTDFQGDS